MKSKCSLLLVLLVFAFASCYKEKKVETQQKGELELLVENAKTHIKNGYNPIVKSDPEAFKKMILEDKLLLKELEKNGLDVNVIFEPNLQTRTDCNGFSYSCSVLEYYADADRDGLFSDAEYNVVKGLELGIYTINDAISLGYPYINNVRYLSCFAMCEGSNCNDFSFWDVILYARVKYGTLLSQHCY